MKREDIKKAANEFAYREYEISDIDRTPLYKGFYHGTEWRINSVWHNGEERPKRGAEVLIMLDNSIILKAKFEGWGYSYCTNVEFDHVPEVTRWAYIEDLLPNTED